MKAISPSLPTPAPARNDASSSPSAADEAFGAVIAAALGIASPAPISHTPSSARQDRDSRDDRSVDRSGGSREARSTADTHDTRDTDTTDQTSASSKPDDAHPASSGDNTTSADAPASTNTPRPTSGAGAAQPAGSSVALDHASAALAKALSDDAGKPTAHPAIALNGAGKLQQPAGNAVPLADAPVTQNPLLAAAITAAPKTVAPAKGDAKPAAAPAVASQTTPLSPKAVAAQTSVAAGVSSSGVMSQAVAQAAPQPQSQAQPQPPAAKASAANGAQDAAAPIDAAQLAANPAAGAASNPQGGSAHHDGSAALGASANAMRTGGDDRAPGGNSAFDSALQAATSAAPTLPGAATTQAAPTGQPTPTPPQGALPQQIVQVVAPLRSAGDGNYTLSLQLHPADLGAVTVHVVVNDGVMSVQLVPDQSHGHDALTGSLPDLRSQLQAGGIRVGDIDVGTKASLSQQQSGQNSNQNSGQTSNQNSGQLGQQGGSSHQHSHSAFAQPDQGGYDANSNRQPLFRGNGHGVSTSGESRDMSASSAEHLVSAGQPAGANDAALDVRI